jgi:hypothetical protein
MTDHDHHHMRAGVIAFLKETITKLAQEYAEATIAYYSAKGARNEAEALRTSSRASGILDSVTSTLAAYVVLGSNPIETLRSRARATTYGPVGAARLNEIADEIIIVRGELLESSGAARPS